MNREEVALYIAEGLMYLVNREEVGEGEIKYLANDIEVILDENSIMENGLEHIIAESLWKSNKIEEDYNRDLASEEIKSRLEIVRRELGEDLKNR